VNAGLAVKSGHQKADLGCLGRGVGDRRLLSLEETPTTDDALRRCARHTPHDASIDSRVRLCPHRIFLTVLLLIKPQSTQELLGGRQLGQALRRGVNGVRLCVYVMMMTIGFTIFWLAAADRSRVVLSSPCLSLLRKTEDPGGMRTPHTHSS